MDYDQAERFAVCACHDALYMWNRGWEQLGLETRKAILAGLVTPYITGKRFVRGYLERVDPAQITGKDLQDVLDLFYHDKYELTRARKYPKNAYATRDITREFLNGDMG